MEILYNLQKKERHLENFLISSERKIENWLASRLAKVLKITDIDKSWAPKNLSGPYLSYYIKTHPKPNEIKIDKRYHNKKGLKINLGAGHLFKDYAPDWVTIDICEHGEETGTDIKMDFGQEPLPLADNSVDLAFCSHTVEHLDKVKLVYLLNELARVMSPQGVLRIVCPDLEQAVKAYYEKDKEFFWRRWHAQGWKKWNHPISLRGGLETLSVSECLSHEVACLNNTGNMSHVNALDFEYLSLLLRDSGFKHVIKSTSQGSVIPEMRAEHFDNIRDHYNLFSVYVEASQKLNFSNQHQINNRTNNK